MFALINLFFALLKIGPGRGKSQPPASAYPVMLHQNPSNYATAAGSTAPQPDLYAGNLDGVGDPSSEFSLTL